METSLPRVASTAPVPAAPPTRAPLAAPDLPSAIAPTRAPAPAPPPMILASFPWVPGASRLMRRAARAYVLPFAVSWVKAREKYARPFTLPERRTLMT